MTTLLLGLLLALVSREFPLMLRPAQRLWVRGNLLQPTGFVLMALRGQIDDLFSVLLANLLIVVAFADYMRALHRLMQRPDPRRAARVAVMVLMLPIIYFTWVDENIAVRIVAASLVLAALAAGSAGVLLRPGQPHGRSMAQWVTGCAFAIGALVLLVRAGVSLVFPASVEHALQSTAVQAMTFLTGALLPMTASYGFLLLCTDRMRLELERSAETDFLTGTLNRRAIESLGTTLVARARRRGRSCALILLDVDNFKRINDELGHPAGDAALREIASRLRQVLREEDLIGRIGGEEFLVLVEDTGADRAGQLAERLRRVLCDAPLALDSGPCPVTISLGVAMLQEDDTGYADLMRRADRALYRAKDAGRDRVEYAPA